MCIRFLAVVTEDKKVKQAAPLKVRLEECRKTGVRGDAMKFGIADHVWKKRGSH